MEIKGGKWPPHAFLPSMVGFLPPVFFHEGDSQGEWRWEGSDHKRG